MARIINHLSGYAVLGVVQRDAAGHEEMVAVNKSEGWKRKAACEYDSTGTVTHEVLFFAIYCTYPALWM